MTVSHDEQVLYCKGVVMVATHFFKLMCMAGFCHSLEKSISFFTLCLVIFYLFSVALSLIQTYCMASVN